ncbi:hypothetical protein C3L33_06477, partial [Rhododendron williamsianum]
SMSRVSATHDEEASARAAAATADTGAPTIFDKIIAKEIPSTIVYEDEKVLAFRDINPQAPVHVLVIPKLRDGLTDLGKAEERHRDILGELLYAAKIVAEKEGILDGFRVVINSGPAACKLKAIPYSIFCLVFSEKQTKCKCYLKCKTMLTLSLSGQSVYHLHLHVLGGRQMKWPPG